MGLCSSVCTGGALRTRQDSEKAPMDAWRRHLRCSRPPFPCGLGADWVWLGVWPLASCCGDLLPLRGCSGHPSGILAAITVSRHLKVSSAGSAGACEGGPVSPAGRQEPSGPWGPPPTSGRLGHQPPQHILRGRHPTPLAPGSPVCRVQTPCRENFRKKDLPWGVSVMPCVFPGSTPASVRLAGRGPADDLTARSPSTLRARAAQLSEELSILHDWVIRRGVVGSGMPPVTKPQVQAGTVSCGLPCLGVGSRRRGRLDRQLARAQPWAGSQMFPR